MHNMVEPRMRATATAILFLTLNLIGLGLGPTLVGVASDLYAAAHFQTLAHAVGTFANLCPGGRPRAGVAAGLAQACQTSSAYGVRWALVTCTATFLWAGLHYALAARTLRRDMAEG
jgi:hypothetical protein